VQHGSADCGLRIHTGEGVNSRAFQPSLGRRSVVVRSMPNLWVTYGQWTRAVSTMEGRHILYNIWSPESGAFAKSLARVCWVRWDVPKASIRPLILVFSRSKKFLMMVYAPLSPGCSTNYSTKEFKTKTRNDILKVLCNCFVRSNCTNKPQFPLLLWWISHKQPQTRFRGGLVNLTDAGESSKCSFILFAEVQIE